MNQADIKIVVKGEYQAKLADQAKKDAAAMQAAFEAIDSDIPVDADTRPAEAKIGVLEADIEALDGDVEVGADTALADRALVDLEGDLDDLDGEVVVGADTREATGRLGRLRELFGRVRDDAEIDVEVDDDQATRRIDGLRRLFGRFRDDADDVEVGIDDADANRRLGRLRSLLGRVRDDADIDVEVDDADAGRRVERLRGLFGRLRSEADIDVDLDTDDAMRELDGLRTAAGAIPLGPVSVEVETTEAQGRLDRLRGLFGRLRSDADDIDVEVETTEAERRVGVLGRMLGRLDEGANVDVEVNTVEAERRTTNLARLIGRLSDRADVDVDVDTTEATTKVARLDDALEDLDDEDVHVYVDDISAKQRLQDLWRQLRGLDDEDVRVDVEDGDARSRLQRLRDLLRGLRGVEAEVDLDTGSAEAEITRLESDIRDLKDIDAFVQLDVGTAQQHVSRLESGIRHLETVRPELTVETGPAVRRVGELTERIERALPELTVGADTEGAKRELLALPPYIERLGDPVDVDLRTQKAEAAVVRLEGEAIAMGAAMDHEVDLDTSEAERRVVSLEGDLDDLSTSVELELWTGDAERSLVSLEGDIAGLDTEVELDVDTGAASRSLVSLEGDLESVAATAEQVESRISGIDPKVDVDTSEAERKLVSLEGDLKALGPGPIPIDADTGPAEAKVRMLKAAADDAVDVQVLVDTAQAEGEIGGLADRMRSRMRGAFDSIDFRGAGQQMAGAVESAFDSVDWGGVGSDAGSAVGSAFTDNLDSISGSLPLLGAGMAAMGALWGEQLAQGLNDGFNEHKIELQTSLRTGLDPSEMREVGGVAADLYGRGFGENLQSVQHAAALVKQEIGSIDDDLDLSQGVAELLAITTAMEVDVPAAVQVAQRWINQGLVKDFGEAMDVMATMAQEFPAAFDEGLDVMNEFGPVFAKMGLDGEQAALMIGRAWEQGLLPNMSRGAELFEEYNIEISDLEGRAAPVLGRLGLSAKDFQDALADGRGGEAMAQLVTELLAVEDAGLRDDLAMELLGASIESASDRAAVLELILQATAGQMDSSAASADVMAKRTEEAATGFELLQRDAEGAARAIGSGLADAIGWLYEQHLPLIDAAKSLSEEVGGLQGVFGNLIPQLNDSASTLDLVTDAKSRLEDMMERDNVGPAAERLGTLHDAADETEASLEELEAQAQATKDALDAWADDTGEAALRRIYSAAEDLTEGLDGTTAAAYSLTEGWDLTTEAGLRGSEMAADYRSRMVDLKQALVDGKISSDDYAAATDHVRAELEDALRQAGLTEDQIDQLTDSLLAVPDVDPEVNAHGDAWDRADDAQRKFDKLGATSVFPNVDARGNAWDRAEEILGKLNSLNGKSVSTYINTYDTKYVTTQYRTQGASGFRRAGGVAASGGARNDLVMVGEEGPELVRLGVGAQVYSTSDTDAMMMATMGGQRRSLASMGGGGGGGGGSLTVNVAVHGSVLSERDLRGHIADAIRRGGLDSIGGLR